MEFSPRFGDARLPSRSDSIWIPNLNHLSCRGLKLFDQIQLKFPDISERIAALIAFYYEWYADLSFTCDPWDIVFFKAAANPDHSMFDPVFQNVLQTNPSLQEEIAAIQVDYQVHYWFR